MEIANLLSDIILIASGTWIVFQLGRFVYRSVRFIYNALYGDIVLTNPRTGKSVTLGRHHRDGLSKEIQDILD